MLKIFSIFILSSLLFTSSLGFNSFAEEGSKKASKNKSDRSSYIAKLIKDNDPFKFQSKKLIFDSNNHTNILEYETNTKIDPSSKKITVKNKKGLTSVDIPYGDDINFYDVEDDKIIYSNLEKKFDLAIELIDGGFRQMINIQSPESPNFYDFPLTLEVGDLIQLTDEGSGIIKNSKGESKLIIGKPWAKDADNKDVKTWYTVEKGGLRQYIDFKNSTFPILADPLWCGAAIDKVEWINRNGAWSSSNYPTGCGAWNCANQWACWQEAYDKTPSSSQWNKQWNTNQYWSMYNQFMCHADIPRGTKTPWNIEPAKADKGYWGFANFWDQCN